jgi:hypothetical protein
VGIGVRDAVGVDDPTAGSVGLIVGGRVGVVVLDGGTSSVASTVVATEVARLLLASKVAATEVATTLSFASKVAAAEVASAPSFSSRVNAIEGVTESSTGSSVDGVIPRLSRLHAKIISSAVLIMNKFFFIDILLLSMTIHT